MFGRGSTLQNILTIDNLPFSFCSYPNYSQFLSRGRFVMMPVITRVIIKNKLHEC